MLPDHAEDRAVVAAEIGIGSISPGTSRQSVSFRDRLVTGLQARRKSEVLFVEGVVDLVQTGRLPRRLVDETFFWARQRTKILRRGRSRRPIIYFQPALRARLNRLGLQVGS